MGGDRGAPTPLCPEWGGIAPPKSKPSDITNLQDLPLFMTDTLRSSQNLPRIASKIKHTFSTVSLLQAAAAWLIATFDL